MALPTTNLLARFIAGTGQTVSGGRVTAWADQSGNGLDAAQGTNAPWSATDYLTRPVVRFDGQANNLPASMTFGAAHTFTARNIACFIIGRFAAGTQSHFSAAAATSSILRSLPASSGQPIYYYAQSRPSALTMRNNPMLVGVVSTSTNQNIYGTYQDFAGLTVASATSGTGATIGATSGLTGNATFDAYEILVYEGTVTTQMLTDIRAYAVSTYSLRSTAYTRNVVFEGDSITQGITTTLGAQFFATSYPSQVLRASTEDWKLSNLGVSGATMTTVAARAAGADGYYDATCTKNVLIGLIGRNDAVAGDSAATIYANIKTYVQARVAAGWQVWWGTCIATGASQSVLDTLNGLLRGTPLGGSGPGLIADAGASRIVDFAALPQFDPGSQTDTTYYQTDLTHPTPAGAGVMAGLVAPLLVAEAGSGVAVKTLTKVGGTFRKIVRSG